MKISIKSASKKAIAAIVAAMVAGSAVTVAVFAAIPSVEGVINGCYSNTSGALKVVDSTATCSSGETNLKWDRGLIAYAHVHLNDTTNNYETVSGQSTNIDSILSPNEGFEGQVACLKLDSSVAGSIRFALTSALPSVSSANPVAIAGNSGSEDAYISMYCSSGTDVAVFGGTDFYVSVF